jgi:MinD superfamily P-loop ATPase
MVTEKGMRLDLLQVIHLKPVEIPVISITGGKGGVGKSAIAVNIAEALVQRRHKVSLVDADVDAPDDHILLNIPLRNPREVLLTVPVINDRKCTRCRKCVDVCRRHALFQPDDSSPVLIGECNGCETCTLVCTPGAIERGKRTIGRTYMSKMKDLTLFTGELVPGSEESAFVVNALKERAFHDAGDSDIIIIDTSAGIHCNVIDALKGSDEAIIVTEPTPIGHHDLKRILGLVEMFHIRSQIIINRSDLPGIQDEIVSLAETSGAYVTVEIPEDDLLFKSYVEGVPVTRRYPEAESAKKIVALSEELVEKYIK